MKIKFASTKLVFNNANECQTGRSFVVSLSELVNGNSYKLVLQKTKDEGSLSFKLNDSSGQSFVEVDDNTQHYIFEASSSEQSITVFAQFVNLAAFVLIGSLSNVTNPSLEPVEDFITIICDPLALIPSATPTNTATPTTTPTYTPSLTASTTVVPDSVAEINVYDKSQNLRLEEKLYKDSKGTQFWAMSDLKGVVQTIPGKDDLYLKKSGENVLFKLEEYTTDDIVEIIAVSVTLDDKSLTHNGAGNVTPTFRLNLGNPTTPLITDSYNVNNKDLVITAKHDGEITLKVGQEEPSFNISLDSRIEIKKNNIVIDTVDNKVTELNPFTDISPITISVNKNDTISFNITNGNSVSSIKLEANYTSDKVGFLINGELNPTLNLKKNSRYNFNINTGQYAFWIQKVAGELNLAQNYDDIIGTANGTITIDVIHSENIDTLYYASSPAGSGAYGTINLQNTDFVKIADYILCPTPTPTPPVTPSTTPTNSPTATITPSNTTTQTPTTTQTTTPNKTPTPTATQTPTVTNTQSVTPTITPSATDVRNVELYFMSDSIHHVCDLPPDNDAIDPYHKTKSITVDRFTTDNQIVNNEFEFDCVNGSSFIVQLGNLTVGNRYKFNFSVVHDNESGLFSVQPNQETFIAKEITQNINIISFYSGSSNKILVKFSIENLTTSITENEFFIFSCSG